MKRRYGRYGGCFAPEVLMPALEEVEEALNEFMQDPDFQEKLKEHLAEFAGRPTPLYFAGNLSRKLGKRIYLKREDLVHGGAHKLNNTLGQALLTRKMNKDSVVAETGAGQHGVASAMAASALGLNCKVFMGQKDIKRQRLNVFRMRLLGAKVIPVKSGSKTLKDATNEAIRYWLSNLEDTHYMIGSIVGPHPYPAMVKGFQRVIGDEARKQYLEKERSLPEAAIACVGGGSNAIGLFTAFLQDNVDLVGVEAGGEGLSTRKHGASLSKGTDGILHGAFSKLIQDEYGQIEESYSLAAGLDYPGVGPELAHLMQEGRVKIRTCLDEQAVEAFKILCKSEGIVPALESSHAIHEAVENNYDEILICLSGRGDKDVYTIADHMDVRLE